MVLVDTSVWIDFLRVGNDLLEDLLNDGEVMIHPFIVGELYVGNIPKRNEFLSLLENLPHVEKATDEEVLNLIEDHKIYTQGIGYIDVHLLCSSILSEVSLWTLDKRLAKLAKSLS